LETGGFLGAHPNDSHLLSSWKENDLSNTVAGHPKKKRTEGNRTEKQKANGREIKNPRNQTTVLVSASNCGGTGPPFFFHCLIFGKNKKREVGEEIKKEVGWGKGEKRARRATNSKWSHGPGEKLSSIESTPPLPTQKGKGHQ